MLKRQNSTVRIDLRTVLCQGEITVENKLHQGTFLYGKTCEYKYGQSYY